MAQRVKTIEYTTGLDTTSLATATARAFTTFTAYAPETTSRTIRSAFIELSMRDNVTTATSLTAVAISVQIDAVAPSSATVTQTISASGENQSFVFLRDVTAYFQTNFTGASHDIIISRTITGPATINASAKLILTYEYDDAAATTRIKTVKIPINGNTGALTTTLANLGGVANQLPALDTFLPEASKVYRQVFVEWTSNSGTTAAAASVLNIAYNGVTISDGSHPNTLNSAVFYRRMDLLTVGTHISTSAATSLQASTTSTTGGPFGCLCGVLIVTYEYNHSTSTRIMNSIQLPSMDESGLTGGTAVGDLSRWDRFISIQEPGTITLAQSGVMASYMSSGAPVVAFAIGGQTAVNYTGPSGLHCGSMAFMRRFDSGGTGGAGFTVARGENEITLDWYATSGVAGNIPSNMSACIFLNYTSDKHSLGDGVHAHTTQWINTPYQTGFTGTSSLRVQVTPSTTPNIPETNYWLGGYGFNYWAVTNGTVPGPYGFAVQAEVQAGEAEGAGWRPVYNGLVQGALESGPQLSFGRARDDFERWPQDPDTSRLNPETSRSYRFDNSITATTTLGVISQLYHLVTHHAITYEIAGTISGSAGGTVTINAHRVSDGLRLGTTSRIGNGTFTIPWYDNTAQVYVEAYENDTLIGRSAPDLAA